MDKYGDEFDGSEQHFDERLEPQLSIGSYEPRAKPDGVTDPAGEAGWYLMREREARNESLESAGEATGIHPYHIEAIEFGDMTCMPPRMEALEMIAAYAQYLGFDPQPLVEHYVKFLPRPAVAPRTQHPAHPQPNTSAKVLAFGRMPKLPVFNFKISTIPGGAGGIVASVAAVMMLFAGASWMMSGDGAPSAQQVAQIQADESLNTASTTTEEAIVKVTETPMADDNLAALADDTTAVNEDSTGEDPDALGAFISEQVTEDGAVPKKKKVKTVDVAAAEVLPAGDGRSFGAAADGARLVLKAKAPVWVRVEDGQGNVVMTQMLMKGDSYRVPDRPGLVVIARDGGLLSYLIDGQEKGILGPPGEILVGRSLDLTQLDG
jgi:cytoskeleton protein RodZ